MNALKDTLRELCIFLHLDLTKNLEYDRLTRKILKQVLRKGSSCVDVGCHKGEILDLMLSFAPNGKHLAFEPIPSLFNELSKKYSEKASIYPYALAEENGETSFQFVKNAPAYSGIKRRRYAVSEPDVEEIRVEMRKLDDILSPAHKIDFIKIDVEGGEFGVLKGAIKCLKANKPYVLFECGLGASDYYNTDPSDLYRFLTEEIGLKIYTLKHFIQQKNHMDLPYFTQCFKENSEYYFIAAI